MPYPLVKYTQVTHIQSVKLKLQFEQMWTTNTFPKDLSLLQFQSFFGITYGHGSLHTRMTCMLVRMQTLDSKIPYLARKNIIFIYFSNQTLF